jgi:hypothetical protein
MRVFAINSSPRLKNSSTALVLDPFLDGMRDAGAEVELFLTKKLNIKPCTGEFECWDRSSGKCRIRDDMDVIIPKMKKAEMWVFGIPVYVPMPGEMQNLLNRMMPLLESKIVVRGNRMLPHKRADVNVRKVALISSCGYWELANFDELVRSMERVANVWDAEFALPVLRPHSDALRAMLKAGHEADDVILAARQAGKELVTEGCIHKKTVMTIGRPLVSFENFTREFEIIA